LPPTLPLQKTADVVEARRKPSEDLSVEPEDFTEAAPPRAQFETPDQRVSVFAGNEPAKRPRIVVPISLEAQRQMELRVKQELNGKKASQKKPTTGASRATVLPPSRGRRALVALGLIMAFSGMLLATHKYVTSHWNPLTTIPRLGDTFVIGREGVTTTDVNLRPVANTTNAPIGLAELGSKVKVLSADSNWYEVQVVEHGRPKIDPYSSDRGWINKRFVKFN
jgi:hypothetical protein